jgi:hypothetical protein
MILCLKSRPSEEREKTKLGLIRFRPIINITLGDEPVFMVIISRSTKAFNSVMNSFSARKTVFCAINKDSLFISLIIAVIVAKSKKRLKNCYWD